jgi:hypothetical protein
MQKFGIEYNFFQKLIYIECGASLHCLGEYWAALLAVCSYCGSFLVISVTESTAFEGFAGVSLILADTR